MTGVGKRAATAAARQKAIEAELIRCASEGVCADFSAPKWRGRRKGKPKVAGAFLSRLWLGLEECRVHPCGIEVKGLAIEGMLDLGGARVDARLRTPLVGFSADDCDFPDGFSIANAKVEGIYFTKCSFGKKGDTSAAPFMAYSADILGRLSLVECVCHGMFYAENIVVDDNLILRNLDCADTAALFGAEIRGALLVHKLSFDGAPKPAPEAKSSMMIDGAVIGDRVHITSSSFPDGLSLGRASVDGLVISDSRIGLGERAAKLELGLCAIARNFALVRTRVFGGVGATGAKVGGSFGIRRCVIGLKGTGSLALFGSNVAAASLTVESSRLYGPCWFQQSTFPGKFSFERVDIELGESRWTALNAEALTAGELVLKSVHIGGYANFSYAAVQSISLSDVFSNPLSGAKRRSPGEGVSGSAITGVDFYLSKVARSIHIADSAIAGGLSLSSVEVGNRCKIATSWLGGPADANALIASTARIADLFILDRIVAPGGLRMPLLRCSEIQISGSRIGSADNGDMSSHCIWMTEAEIGRCLSIFRNAQLDGEEGGNIFHGVADFGNCRITGDVIISSVRIVRDRKSSPDEGGVALTFAGSRIDGRLTLSGDPVPTDETPTKNREFPPEIEGAVMLDDATIQHVSIGDGTSIAAVGDIRPPAGDSGSADRVRRRKSGVALSMVGAKVSRRFRIGKVDFHGLADLRDASVGEIADAGGERWLQGGILPGHLLLDGLTYEDLDDDEEVASTTAAGQGSHARPKGAVERRIDWLSMQYVDRRASAASFTPQPYEQLARHYAQMGDERARRQVHVARRNLQRRHSGLGTIERWSAGALNFVSRYGYSPGRASAVTAIFFVIGGLLAWHLAAIGAIVADDPGNPPAQPFSPLLYAIDVAVPFLDLGYDGDWVIDSRRLAPFFGRDPLVATAMALYRLAGLVLLSITVLTFSGVLREKD